MNKDRKPKTPKQDLRSIINNINSAPPGLESANYAKYLLTKIKETTGETQMLTISKCIIYAVKNAPEYAGFYKALEEAWNNGDKDHWLYKSPK